MKVTPEDALFSKYVRLLADGVCEYCGRTVGHQKLHCSHFHGRRKLSTRHDPDNVSAICGGCHTYFHDNPNIHTEFFQKKLGSSRYEELNIRAQTILKRTTVNKKELRADLRSRIKRLEAIA